MQAPAILHIPISHTFPSRSRPFYQRTIQDASKNAGEGYVFNFDANSLRNLATFGPTIAVQ